MLAPKPTGNFIVVSFKTYHDLKSNEVALIEPTGSVSPFRLVVEAMSQNNVGYVFYKGAYCGRVDLSPMVQKGGEK